MRVAVTGASGHMGANLVRQLVAQGFRTRALYRSPNHLNALEGIDAEIARVDVTELECLEAAFAGIEAVFHLAGVISIDGDPDGSVMRTNVLGTRNVARACMTCGVRKLIHFSSIHALKIRRGDGVVDEEHPEADQTCFLYDHSKALGEQEIRAAVQDGLDAMILNPTGIMGPNDFQPSHAGQMLRDLFEGKMRILVRGGFDWVDVRDVSQAAIKAVSRRRSGHRYILSGHWVDFSTLSQICNAVTGRNVSRLAIPIGLARAALPASRLFDTLTGRAPLFTEESLHIIQHSSAKITSAKAQRELGFIARPIEETVRDTLTWMRSQGMV